MENSTQMVVRQRFFGAVSEVKDGGAYGFIAETMDPYGQVLNTNGDIYVSRTDCDGTLESGLMLEFEVAPDPRRSGKFKAVQAKATRHLPVLAATQQELQVMGVRTSYHDHAKYVDPIQVRRAVANKPFADAINASLENTVLLETERDVEGFILAYLRQKFPGIESVGVQINMETAGNDQERAMIEQQIRELEEIDMGIQAASLTNMYELYVATCEMLRECRSRGIPAPGMQMTMGMMSLLVGCFDIADLRAKGDAGTMADIKARAELSIATIRYLRDNDILRPGCVIPIGNLPDILMAAPVWYVASKEEIPTQYWNMGDPLPDKAVQYFCQTLGANQTWANLFQIWNRRTRTLARYEGDQIPPHIRRAIKLAREWFDFVVIATPYHDAAGREWEDPNWQRQIDPFLYGFKKGLPFVYFLGRWSDSGIFPLMPEMIADTIEYLRANTERLSGFPDRPYWYFADPDNLHRGVHNDSYLLENSTAVLKALAKGMINAFEEERLFDFIRGDESPEIVTP
ncbi:MAG: hypothetical protein ABIB04_04070 [Patescibacteria group bacterium]